MVQCDWMQIEQYLNLSKKLWYFISWFPNRLLKTFMTNLAAQCEAAQCHSYHLRWAALELLHQLLRSLLIAINNPWRCIYPPSPPPPKSSIHVTVKSEQNRKCLIFYSQFFVDNSGMIYPLSQLFFSNNSGLGDLIENN